jgi:hypothetical protein
LTSEDIARLLAELTVDDRERTEDGHVPMIHDPCGGTGRLLLAASEKNPHAELVSMDIDTRCARIMAINFGLRGKYGWVICGNALSFETQFVYRIGSFFHEGPMDVEGESSVKSRENSAPFSHHPFALMPKVCLKNNQKQHRATNPNNHSQRSSKYRSGPFAWSNA